MTTAVETTPRRRRPGVPGAPETVQPDPDQRPIETENETDEIAIDLTGSGGSLVDEGLYRIRVESIEFLKKTEKKPHMFVVKVRITDEMFKRRVLTSWLVVNADPQNNFGLMNFARATGGFSEEDLKALDKGDRPIYPREIIQAGKGVEMWADVIQDSNPDYQQGKKTNKIRTFQHISAH